MNVALASCFIRKQRSCLHNQVKERTQGNVLFVQQVRRQGSFLFRFTFPTLSSLAVQRNDSVCPLSVDCPSGRRLLDPIAQQTGLTHSVDEALGLDLFSWFYFVDPIHEALSTSE